MKPMLASDLVEEKLRFPCGLQPKIDGVRALSPGGVFTGRSLKPLANRYTTAFFSQPQFANFDGELVANRETHPDLCRLTTSATSTIEGQPYLVWWLFDYLAPHMLDQPYQNRYNELQFIVDTMKHQNVNGFLHQIQVVPMKIANTLEDYLSWEDVWLTQGYEGIIIRDLDRPYKMGRSTVKEMGLLRGKRFLSFEMRVTSIIEGTTNANEAQTNELGYTFRSTHQENMVLNGMVGAIDGVALEDVKDPQTGEVLIAKGQSVRMGPGEMPHNMRLYYWQNPHELLGKIAKGKFFPKGMKDKPRFPIFQCLRSPEDM